MTLPPETPRLGPVSRRLGITVVVLGLVVFIGSLAFWIYLVAYCGNAFSSQSSLNLCKSYFTDTQLSHGGLANILPLSLQFLMILGLALLLGGVLVLVARAYPRR